MGKKAVEAITSGLGFEYCALRYLLQWQQRERELHEHISGNPLPEHIRSAFEHFKVSRNFAGIRTRASAVVNALQQIDAHPQLSHEAKVVELASEFEKTFNTCNLAAASKLLWLKHKLPYIIYDSHGVDGLEMLGGQFDRANYAAYCVCWRDRYQQHAQKIANAAYRLHDLRKFLPWKPRESELQSLVAQDWFLERVFDIYLWVLAARVNTQE